MRWLVYTMFINNNRTSFQLWWKENLAKHKKVSKYYDHDCDFYRNCKIFIQNNCKQSVKRISTLKINWVLFFCRRLVQIKEKRLYNQPLERLCKTILVMYCLFSEKSKWRYKSWNTRFFFQVNKGKKFY